MLVVEQWNKASELCGIHVPTQQVINFYMQNGSHDSLPPVGHLPGHLLGRTEKVSIETLQLKVTHNLIIK